MSEINVKVMKSSVIESLRKNRKNYLENFKNSENNNWLKEKFGENIYEEKRYKITIPELVFSRELDQNVQNNINLYDSVKELPGYILAEKGFWLWLMFEHFYKYCIEMSGNKKMKASTIEDLWVYPGRRGLFFNILSRMYFRVKLTKDESLEDKYELTKFVIEKQERFRNYGWRTISSYPWVIRGALKAEKAIIEKYGEEAEKSIIYNEGDTKEEKKKTPYEILAKDLQNLGSVKLIDAMTEKDIYDFIYSKYEKIVLNNKKGAKGVKSKKSKRKSKRN